MSALDSRDDERYGGAREAVAGFLAAIALFASALGVAYRPARLVPVAIVVLLVAAVMSVRYSRLVGWALGIAIVCWMIGMTIAVITDRPLY